MCVSTRTGELPVIDGRYLGTVRPYTGYESAGDVRRRESPSPQRPLFPGVALTTTGCKRNFRGYQSRKPIEAIFFYYHPAVAVNAPRKLLVRPHGRGWREPNKSNGIEICEGFHFDISSDREMRFESQTERTGSFPGPRR